MFHRTPFGAVVAAIALTAACSSTSGQAGISTDGSQSATPSTETADSTSSTAPTSDASGEASTVSTDEQAMLFDDSVVHDIEVSYDEADYDAMIDAYVETGEKEWIEATVSIDGVIYEQVGLRLKGNSSLGGLGGARFPGGGQLPDAGADNPSDDTASQSQPDGNEPTGSMPAEQPDPAASDGQARGGPNGGFEPVGSASAAEPESLPWLIRLDEFVEGQQHQGYEDIVVRSNGSATSLNEAVALALLNEAGLASQRAMSTSFSVNGSDAVLRLAIEHPDDDVWQETAFDGDGALYKAESTGDWSYRGENPDDYTEVWDQEGGSDVADLTPLIEFLQFLNESDDATFASELPERLDVDSFATYLAMMDLVANFDDIDGPGNNAYLWYDTGSGQFTVVPWDLNLAFGEGGFGGGPGPGGGRPGEFPTDGTLPEDLELPGGTFPEDFQPPGGSLPEGVDPGQVGGGMFGRSNILVERFHANAEFEALYQQTLTELGSALYDSGTADEILARWVATLSDQATDLIDANTISEEADVVADQFVAE
jgi:spore coat protein CotH